MRRRPHRRRSAGSHAPGERLADGPPYLNSGEDPYHGGQNPVRMAWLRYPRALASHPIAPKTVSRQRRLPPDAPKDTMATTAQPPRQTALITGASSGIGEALAHACARAGFNLVLVARSAAKLAALARQLAGEHGVKAWSVPTDLAQDGAAQQLASKMQRARRPIDLLVNNAGVLEHGAFASMPAQRHRELIRLNVEALTDMLAAFVPPMVARGHGRVLNVASIAAFQPVPSLATYAATKAYVLSLTESLAEELQGSGVSVTALCPGITATAMLDKAARTDDRLGSLPAFVVGKADSVAEQGLQACLRGTVICVPGALNRAVTVAGRAAPRWVVRRVGGAVVRRAQPPRA